MVESISELRKICQSKKQPLYMQHVTMKVSIYITKLLLYFPVSADYVTMSMMVLVILGSVLMGLGALWMVLAGILIIHFTVILDNVNGEVARYRKEAGRIGTFLEQVYHNLSVHLIFFGLAFGVFAATGWKMAIIFGFLCSIFGRPLVLNSVKDAVIAERFEALEKGKNEQIGLKKISTKGGGTKFGQSLYRKYDSIRDFWVFPANIIHINILAVVELLNLKYSYFLPYSAFYWYLVIYGSISLVVQFVSFIVNYRGKTVDHYYAALFKRR